LFGLGGDPPGFLCCSTATEEQKFTMAKDTSCVEVLSLNRLAQLKRATPESLVPERIKPKNVPAVLQCCEGVCLHGVELIRLAKKAEARYPDQCGQSLLHHISFLFFNDWFALQLHMRQLREKTDIAHELHLQIVRRM
jgi:hypothetical protein